MKMALVFGGKSCLTIIFKDTVRVPYSRFRVVSRGSLVSRTFSVGKEGSTWSGFVSDWMYIYAICLPSQVLVLYKLSRKRRNDKRIMEEKVWRKKNTVITKKFGGFYNRYKYVSDISMLDLRSGFSRTLTKPLNRVILKISSREYFNLADFFFLVFSLPTNKGQRFVLVLRHFKSKVTQALDSRINTLSFHLSDLTPICLITDLGYFINFSI